MAVGREPLAQVPVPALGAADGMGVQAVVEEADVHGNRREVRRAFATMRLRQQNRATSVWHARLSFRRRGTRPLPGHGPSRHEHHRAHNARQRVTRRARHPRADRFGRDPLPQRGGEHRAVRPARPRGPRAQRHPGEVVVADNASEDDSAALAAAAGARVVHEPRRGYGSAYLAGFAAARGRYIVMATRTSPTTSTRSRASSPSSRPAPTSSWATAWTTSSRGRCRGCTATSATRSSAAS